MRKSLPAPLDLWLFGGVFMGLYISAMMYIDMPSQNVLWIVIMSFFAYAMLPLVAVLVKRMGAMAE